MIGRYVDELPTLNVPSYIEMDLRLDWRPSRHYEFAIVGQNLLNNHHLEFATGAPNVEVQRGVYGQLTWRR